MYLTNTTCPYCGRKALYMDSGRIYGNGKSYGMVYACLPCGAWVGVHKGSNRPLGTLADAELRQWRRQTHEAFDPLWRSGKRSRKEAYEWLSRQMKIPFIETHIARFDAALCKLAIKICNEERNIKMANATQVTTGKVRFSYCNLFTPRAMAEGAEEKYSVTLIIPKSDKQTLQKIKAAMAAAKEAYNAKNSGKPLPANLKSTLHDGDGERPNGGEFGEECKGCYVITVSSKNKPVVVDAGKLPITEPQELYSGCYGRAIINFFAYSTNGNRGISAGLNGIMKLHDGEPLGGGIVTDEDWDDDWVDPDDDGMGDLLG